MPERDADVISNRNNNKQVDLSRTYRLSGLSSGAKLELVLLSRSPSVVSVALQLPESEAKDFANGRLTDKFPSTTTLWLILRKFESGANGGGNQSRNFTARGVAQTKDGDSGVGRLYYETPVLQVMGRELSSFTDLQKTLGQLGFNSGSTLLRLSFRATQMPLEEAMAEIEQYFKSVENDETSAGAHAGSAATMESRPEMEEPATPNDTASPQPPPEPVEASSSTSTTTTEPVPTPTPTETHNPNNPHSSPQPPTPDPTEDTITGPNNRPITIFSPPSHTTPHAALRPHNESDYEPTLDHARLHQSRLSTTARNKRLPSEAELAAQQKALSEKVASVNDVEIKIRFPDQSQVVAKFTALDTAGTLYDFVREMLESEGQPFLLSSSAMGGPRVLPRGGRERLVAGLGMRGRVLVTFMWDENASLEARTGEVLKGEFREKAREIEIKEVEGVDVGEGEKVDKGKGKGKERVGDGEREGGGKKGGVPKWLKLPGKK
ncbi:MAG: hypothetical protein M1830_004675 [Pleopsidium flavum]|nr:MAG: hypothetical protein M1830_004675 [Pleopsidium flavum]